MEDTATVPQLDPAMFTLSSFDNVHISMPPEPAVSSEDVDAELFQYVASAGKGSGITSIADLDDEWVKSTFDGLETITQLREALERDLVRQDKRNWANVKFQKCSDALAAKLEGDTPADILEANIEASRKQYDEHLHSFGMTKAQYLRQEHLTAEEFEEKICEDVAFQLKLNMALDKMIENQGIEVAKEELTDYLSCEDPTSFVAELEELGRVEEARLAAARVKAMRGIVENAVVTIEK